MSTNGFDGGETDGDTLTSKKAALEQRVAAHLEWKRSFFQARPQPLCLGRVARPPGCDRAIGDAPTHVLFKRAREIVAAELAGSGGTKAARHEEEPADIDAASAVPSVAAMKRGAWVAKMRKERDSWNPFTDLNIRSDVRKTVIIANLHPDTVDEDLRVFADQFGRVVSVRVVRNSVTGKSRRYAFVEFGLPAEAKKAASFTRKKRLHGRLLAIDLEKGRAGVGHLPRRLATAAKYDPIANSLSTASAPAKATAETTTSNNEEGTLDAFDDDEAFLQAMLNL